MHANCYLQHYCYRWKGCNEEYMPVLSLCLMFHRYICIDGVYRGITGRGTWYSCVPARTLREFLPRRHPAYCPPSHTRYFFPFRTPLPSLVRTGVRSIQSSLLGGANLEGNMVVRSSSWYAGIRRRYRHEFGYILTGESTLFCF